MRWLLLLIPMVAWSTPHVEVEAEALSTASILDSADLTSNTLAFAFGDVDIRDCIYTVQYFVFFQGARINPLCVADNLDAIGRYKEAAEMRCSIRRYRKPYGSVHQCVRATMFITSSLPEPDNDYEEEQLMLRQQVVDLQQQVEQIQTTQKKALSTIRRASAPVKRESWMSDETRSKLQAILDEDNGNE